MARAFLAALLVVLGAQAHSECRQALALGLDVSASVDGDEYRLQLDGLAAALTDPAVAAAIVSPGEAPIMFAVYEWSDRTYQRLILDWTPVHDRAALDAIAGRLRGWQRELAPATTGLGAALSFGATLIARVPDCPRATIDISGDGKNNDWPRPDDVKASGALDGITVNALVIGQEVDRPAGSEAGWIAELSAYFDHVVIHGPGAFIETALGFSDYEEAMRRKLLREVATMVLGQAIP